MKKWCSLLVAMLPIWVGIVLYIVEITSSGARVNKQNATKLKVGMAKADVQLVFGGMPRLTIGG
jgi:outer membrane protein assembly factor BamE (lipoprotein component of BamABCDE complex)